MPEGPAAALAHAALALHEAIRSHKRAEAAHRRQARALHAQLNRLLRTAESTGVRIEITETPSRRESQ